MHCPCGSPGCSIRCLRAADSPPPYISMAAALAITWVAAAALGLCFGERLIGVLLKLSS